MNGLHAIAIVAAQRDTRRTLARWFAKADYEVATASTFREGRRLLEKMPALVVSELKLGEYNGLHVAAHARTLDIPAIVIGPADIVLEQEAQQLGALYVTGIRQQDLLEIVALELTPRMHEALDDDTAFLPEPRPMLQFPLPGRSLLSN